MIPLIAGFEVDNNVILGVLGILFTTIVGGLIAFYFQVKSFIRDVAGVKEESSVRLEGQPITVTAPTRMATYDELAAVKDDVRKVDSDVQSMRREALESERRLLAEGSRRAGDLHKRMDTSDKLLSAVNERSQNTEAQLTMMNQNLIKFMTGDRK